MSELTKNAIMNSMLELAAVRPLNKITVREVTEACGITRNTFYYYFHDIYDVFDNIIRTRIDEFNQDDGRGLEERLFSMIEFCSAYKHIWVNVYKTVGHDQLAGYVMGRLDDLVEATVRNTPGGEKVSDRDMEIIRIFYSEALFGILVRWITNKEDNRGPVELKQLIDRMRELYKGQIELLIRNSTQG